LRTVASSAPNGSSSSSTRGDTASAFVAGFVGEANRLEGEVKDARFHYRGLSFPAPGVASGPAEAFVRLHHLVLADAEEPAIEVRLERVVFNGPMARLECEGPDGRDLEAGASREQAQALKAGDRVRLAVRGGHVFYANPK
jgi:sulfate transport system ATP-binding protein